MMELRRCMGPCGGWLAADTPPVGTYTNDGVHSPQPVYLCASCAGIARGQQRRVETKEVRPPEVIPLVAAEPDFTRMTLAQAQGAEAAVAGKTEDDCPYPDKRTKDHKEWLRGFREAKQQA